MIRWLTWPRTAVGGIRPHVARSPRRNADVPRVSHVNRVRTRELRIVGVLNVVANAAIQLSIVGDCDMEKAVLPSHLHAVDFAGRLRPSGRVAVYLRFDIVVSLLDG